MVNIEDLVRGASYARKKGDAVGNYNPTPSSTDDNTSGTLTDDVNNQGVSLSAVDSTDDEVDDLGLEPEKVVEQQVNITVQAPVTTVKKDTVPIDSVAFAKQESIGIGKMRLGYCYFSDKVFLSELNYFDCNIKDLPNDEFKTYAGRVRNAIVDADQLGTYRTLIEYEGTTYTGEEEYTWEEFCKGYVEYITELYTKRLSSFRVIIGHRWTTGRIPTKSIDFYTSKRLNGDWDKVASSWGRRVILDGHDGTEEEYHLYVKIENTEYFSREIYSADNAIQEYPSAIKDFFLEKLEEY